jgi:hypothetical protein
MDVSQVSAELFGRACRLPLALWILRREKPRFYQSEPPLDLGPASAVRQELQRFTRAGLLAQERPDGENRVYYVRTDSPLWEVIEAAASAVDGGQVGSGGYGPTSLLPTE